MSFAKKSLGQNYLIDKNIIKKIINSVKIKNNHIVEIGPGKGALTREIIKKNPKSLILIEKDNQLSENLKKNLSNTNKTKIKIYNEDILRFDFKKIKKKRLIIFGNLPYNISSQILVKIIKLTSDQLLLNDLIFMFQKELGEKIIAKFPSKHYGRLSIFTNYKFKIIKKFFVSPNCFFPKPKINSIVIHFKPKNGFKFNIKDTDNLEKVTNVLFSNRRKMINKNLKKLLSIEKINTISGLNINLRPEKISPEIYYKITNLFEN